MSKNNRSGFRQKAAKFICLRNAALCRDAATTIKFLSVGACSNQNGGQLALPAV
jgi:hypothetical protein